MDNSDSGNTAHSVQFSPSVVSNSLQPYGLQHVRLPCSSPTPRACSNSCPLSRWCHPTISSSVVPFSSHLQSFPASGSFQMSQFFASGGQSIRVSASASVLPMNNQDQFPLGWTSWISLLSKGLSRVFSSTQSMFSSVQFSRSVMSDSLRPHELCHTSTLQLLSLWHYFANKGPSTQSYGFSSGYVWMCCYCYCC